MLSRLLILGERLSISSERDRAIWISADATLEWVACISWKDKETFRFPTRIINDLIGLVEYQLVIGECELASAVIAIRLWGTRLGMSRIIVVFTDNLNVCQWL